MEIAKRWLRRAKKSHDAYDKFVYAYFALNYLYGQVRLPKEGEGACMVRYMAEQCERHSFDPLSLVVDEFRRVPVHDMKTGREYPVSNTGSGNALFEAIYHVRCNLFHGNKCIGDTRDRRLARQGANVITELLSRIVAGDDNSQRVSLECR